jgi:hypothetical protein
MGIEFLTKFVEISEFNSPKLVSSAAKRTAFS